MNSLPLMALTTRVSAYDADDGEDVLLGEDQQLLVVELELGAGVLGEEHLVADLDVQRDAVAVVVAAALAGGEDGAALRLLLGGVGQDDAALGHLLAAQRPDDDPVAERSQLDGGCGRPVGLGS